MPAINALLPVISSQAAKKEGTHTRENETKMASANESVKPENKGLEKDSQELKLADKKRFDEALDEKLQEQAQADENNEKHRLARKKLEDEAMSDVAASGSAVPLTGETLPTSPSVAANNAAFDAEQLTSSAPSTQTSLNSADAQVAEVISSDVGTDAEVLAASIEGQDLTSEPKDGTASLASVASDQESTSSALMGATEDSPELVTASTVPSDTDGDTLKPATSIQASAAQSASKQSGAEETRQPEQADRIRAWRGLNGQELQSPTTQATRQEPTLSASNIEHTGQFQQFAQSLRLAVKQGDSSAVTIGSERGASAASSASASGAESLTSWRTDTAQAHLATSATRGNATASTFAQSMQASNFGQALGEKVGQNAWGESIAQRVSLMAGQKVTSAQIQLDPPELGAMTVKVTVNGDQATVSFQSPHAIVRDALEQSFPRLQEMLGQQGIQLSDAQVSDQSSAQQDSSGRTGGGVNSDGHMADEEGTLIRSQTVQVAKGLIDYYA